MVALDRSGDPIFFLVSPLSLPDLPQATVYQVRDFIKTAVQQYYQHNTYPGCTDPDSPNFSFIANHDDGSCQVSNNNFTFGGVYQTCSLVGFTDLCKDMRQINPLTGNYSCSEEYEAVLLHNGSLHATLSRFSWCYRLVRQYSFCRRFIYKTTATYSAYWCVAKGKVDRNQGLLFGGLYTPTTSNPVNQLADCPSRFYPLRLLGSLVICVSDDYHQELKHSLPFAGFFSCISGNPLSLHSPYSFKSDFGNTHSMMSYMMKQGPSSWPRKCPIGFSEHLAVVDNACQIYYCIKTGSLKHQDLPKIKRPPFMELPEDIYHLDEAGYVFNDDGTVWMSIEEAENSGLTALKPTGSDSSNQNVSDEKGSMSATHTALIAVVSTLVCVIIVIVVGAVYKKRKGKLYQMKDPWEQKLATSGTSLVSSNTRSNRYDRYQESAQ